MLFSHHCSFIVIFLIMVSTHKGTAFIWKHINKRQLITKLSFLVKAVASGSVYVVDQMVCSLKLEFTERCIHSIV